MLRKAEKKQEETLECVACGCSMHLSENCNGLPELTFEVVEVLGAKTFLLWKDCVREDQHLRLKFVAKDGLKRKATQSSKKEVSDLKKSVHEIKSTLNETLSSRQLLPGSYNQY